MLSANAYYQKVLANSQAKFSPVETQEDNSASVVTQIGVIGAGAMGQEIASWSAHRELCVLMFDANPQALVDGMRGTESLFRNRYPEQVFESQNLQACQLEQLLSADVVIESIVENKAVKKRLFEQIAPRLDSDSLLATNTSAIQITELAKGIDRAENFCGVHFLMPVHMTNLVEIIRGPKTNEKSIAKAISFVLQIGKHPLVLNDGPGFVINRLLVALFNEALDLLVQGVPIDEIESAAVDFGLPIGPCQILDLIGLETAFQAGVMLWEAFPQNVVPSPVIPALIKSGRRGRKTGTGFFRYDSAESDPEYDEALLPIIQKYASKSITKLSPQELQERLFVPVVNEATRIIEEGIVDTPSDIDVAMLEGLQMRPEKGGLLYWAEQMGAAEILAKLDTFEALGTRMKPSRYLVDLAKEGRPFFD